MAISVFKSGSSGDLTLVNTVRYNKAGSWTVPEDYKLISVVWLHTGEISMTRVHFSAGNVVINNDVAGRTILGNKTCNSVTSLALNVPRNTKLSWDWDEGGGLAIYCYK